MRIVGLSRDVLRIAVEVWPRRDLDEKDPSRRQRVDGSEGEGMDLADRDVFEHVRGDDGVHRRGLVETLQDRHPSARSIGSECRSDSMANFSAALT